MQPGVIVIVVVLAVLFIAVLMLVAVYNGLVRKRIETDNAWSQIDVQLRRRYDLIPNLVETVKGYAGHERQTLEAVIKARQQAIDLRSLGAAGASAGAASIAAAENMLSGALRQLFALSESYPQLKANENFKALQEELTSTENKIGFARQHYNDSVSRYNTAVQTFPSNLIAGMFNFRGREFFEAGGAEVRETPKVKF